MEKYSDQSVQSKAIIMVVYMYFSKSKKYKFTTSFNEVEMDECFCFLHSEKQI